MVIIFKSILGEVTVHPDSQDEMRTQFTEYLRGADRRGCETVITGYGHSKVPVTTYVNFDSIALIVESNGVEDNGPFH